MPQGTSADKTIALSFDAGGVFRRQTGADLTAARLNLLARENPHEPQWAGLFWADVALVEARAAEPGPRGEHSWDRPLHRARARFAGLRLLDGALVLKVSHARETAYVRIIDGGAFDPARSGLEVAMPPEPGRRERCVMLRRLDPIVFRNTRASLGQPRSV